MALKLPDFASEGEEADWWYDHREEISDLMAGAIENGTAIRMQDFLREHNLLIETEPATVEVLTTDAERARKYAAAKGMAYEEYLASLVHTALEAQVA